MAGKHDLTSRVLFWGATLALISFALLHVVSYSARSGPF